MSTDSENMDELDGWAEAYANLVDDYRADPELRARAESGPAGVLAEYGFQVPAGVDLRIAADTAETFHVVFPPDPNTELADDTLNAVAGGFSVSFFGNDFINAFNEMIRNHMARNNLNNNP